LEEEKVVEQGLAPEPAQKMLSQEQVNMLIGREKKDAAEKARREAEAYYTAELEKVRGQGQAPQQSMGGMNQPNVDDLYQQFEERLLKKAQDQKAQAERQAYEAEMQKIADTYYNKMSTGAEMFEDFGDVMSDFRPEAFPEVVYLASEMENTPQIMYELAKNPHKLASIYSLAKADPNQAKKALKKLSDSIMINEQAQEGHVATNPPLTKPKPSQVSTDKGLNSLKDYKGASWLKT
jgi:hypothetical protein